MNNKYELLKDDFIKFSFFGVNYTVFRIRALVGFREDVKEGQLGGYVSSEENLTTKDEAWVYDNAIAYGGATVTGNATIRDNSRVGDRAIIAGFAKVYNDARVFGCSIISEYAEVYGSAEVFDSSRISGSARIYNGAKVFGNAWIHGNSQVYQMARVFGESIVSGDSKVYGCVCVSSNIAGTSVVYRNFHVAKITNQNLPLDLTPQCVLIGTTVLGHNEFKYLEQSETGVEWMPGEFENYKSYQKLYLERLAMMEKKNDPN